MGVRRKVSSGGSAGLRPRKQQAVQTSAGQGAVEGTDPGKGTKLLDPCVPA